MCALELFCLPRQWQLTVALGAPFLARLLKHLSPDSRLSSALSPRMEIKTIPQHRRDNIKEK